MLSPVLISVEDWDKFQKKQNLLERDLRDVQDCSDIFCNPLWHTFGTALCEQLKPLPFWIAGVIASWSPDSWGLLGISAYTWKSIVPQLMGSHTWLTWATFTHLWKKKQTFPVQMDLHACSWGGCSGFSVNFEIGVEICWLLHKVSGTLAAVSDFIFQRKAETST